MSTPDLTAIEAAARLYFDPAINWTFGDAGVPLTARAEGAEAAVLHVTLGYPLAGSHARLASDLQHHLAAHLPRTSIAIELESRIQPQAVQKGLNPLPGVKNILAVASGKGGVGKSTVAVNLALGLQAEGARVGLLDADLYGPSQPLMLGTRVKPTSPDGKRINPVSAHGLQTMSIGFLLEGEHQPTIWRGPMATQALWQMLSETVWDALDYLVVDLPPGTGDIQLSLSQRIPVAGSVIVTTPQDIALLDARKGLEMFRKVGIPVLGIVENMSTHVCANCGHEEAIFGRGGGEKLALEGDSELLGALPLDLRIREAADAGVPIVAADPEGALALRYREIARRTAARLAHGRAAQVSFPVIEVSDD